jgi:hypothetical protein
VRIPQPTVKHKGLIYQISSLMTVIDELGLVCKYSRLYIKVSATGGILDTPYAIKGAKTLYYS